MSTFDVPKGFRRIFKGPLDPTLNFTSEAQMTTYLNDPARYAGMLITLVSGNDASLYQLNATEDAWIPVLTGSGTVFMVNGESGNVVLDADDISDTVTTNKFVVQQDIDNFHSHSNENVLNGTEESFTTELLEAITNIDGGIF